MCTFRCAVAVLLCVVAFVAVSQRRGAAADPDPAPPSAVVDAQSAADAASAAAIAQAYDHPVVVDADTTETTEVTALPTGGLRLTEATVPVRTKSDDGAWVPVDLGLQPDGSSVAPAASAVPVRFSGGGDAPLAQIEAASGQWLSETWAQGALPTPVLAGDTATYPEVLPGVDLVASATPTGLSEVVVVKNAAAAQNPALADVRFGLDSDGMPVRTTPDGQVAVPDDGSAPLRATTATWWDSSSPGADAAGPGDLGLPRPAPAQQSSTQLAVDVAAAAQSSDVTFPVFVDPPWTGGVWSRTYVDTAYPDQSYFNGSGASDSYQHVGYINGGRSDDGRDHTTRAIWNMDTHVVEGAYIADAQFNATEVYSSSCTPSAVQLWVTSGVDSTTTWNNQPTWGAQLGSQSVAHGYSSTCPQQAVGFDVTSTVQTAADRRQQQVSLGLKAASETDWTSWKKFAANATLQVDYDFAPSAPDTLKITPCAFVCTGTEYTNASSPRMQGQASDPDGDTVRYEWQIWIDGHTTPTLSYFPSTSYASGPGHLASFSDPTHTLADGPYQYKVAAWDGQAWSPWSAWVYFVVDTVAPHLPTLSSRSFDLTGQTKMGRPGVAGTVSFASPSADSVYEYYVTSTAGGSVNPPACTAATTPVISASGTAVCGLQSGPSGTSGSASVIPGQTSTSTVYVQAWDMAGNSSTDGSVPQASATYFVLTATQLTHAWPAYTADTDSSITDSTGSAVNLALGGATITPDTPYADEQDGIGALSLSGSGAAPSSNAAIPAVFDVPPSGSTVYGSVAVWVKMTGSSTAGQTVLIQDGPNAAQLRLGTSATGAWQVCLSPTACLTSSISASATWTLLAATWTSTAGSPSSNSLGFFVGYPQQPPKWFTTSSLTSTPASGSIVLGCDHGCAATTFTGDIADPLIYAGTALTTNDVRALAGASPFTTGN